MSRGFLQMGRIFPVFLWLVLGLVGLAGCSGPEEKGAGSNQAAPAAAPAAPTIPEQGDRLVTGAIGEPSNLISALSTDASSHEVANLLNVSCLKYDKNLTLVSHAADFEVLEDGKLLRFTLKPGIRWWDGVELTARDVEFTYRLMVDPKTPTAYAENYKHVKEFKVTGAYTFEVRYDEVLARSLSSWATDILPRHALEGQDLLTTRYSREPLGAGPFKLASWEPGRSLTLVANPDYFEGRPHLDAIVYRIIPDQSTMFLELKAGNLDLSDLTPQQYSFQTSGPEWEKNFRKYSYVASAYTYLGYNLESPLFRDKAVRQALAHAVDKEEIVKGVLLGLGQPAEGPYKPGTWAYNDKLKPWPYDPAKARAMLAEAGWRDSDGDGVLDRDGKPFAFTILTNQGNEQRAKAATIIQSRLKEVGVAVQIRAVEWAAFIKEFVDKGRFDAVLLGWNTIPDPDAFDVWHSSQTGPGKLNFIGYRNPEVDEILDKARRSLDMAVRKPLYDRFQEILQEDQPYLFLYTPRALPVVSARFRGVEPAPAGIGHNLIWWWVPKAEQRYAQQP
ncbi:MAG: peptide-binding protein [Thermodesulfobacteriota bacterium]